MFVEVNRLKLLFPNECVLGKRMKLGCGIVVNLIKQLTLKVNENIIFLNLKNTKKSIVPLLKNIILFDTTIKR